MPKKSKGCNCKCSKHRDRTIKEEMEDYALRVFGKSYNKLTEREQDKAYFWAKDIVRSS